MDPSCDAVLDIDTVGHKCDVARAGKGLKATNGGCEFHTIVGGMFFAASQFLLSRTGADQDAPATGAGLPLQAPSVTTLTRESSFIARRSAPDGAERPAGPAGHERIGRRIEPIPGAGQQEACRHAPRARIENFPALRASARIPFYSQPEWHLLLTGRTLVPSFWKLHAVCVIATSQARTSVQAK